MVSVDLAKQPTRRIRSWSTPECKAGSRRAKPAPGLAARDPGPTEAIYLMTPVKDEGEVTARETLESLLGHNVYVFGDRTPGRKRIKAGDRISFYWSAVGVVADAVITGPAERREVAFAKDLAHYPWAFGVRDVRFYFDAPVVIDAALRSRLDAFVKHGNDPNGNWAFLVQGTRYLTAHDFALLTRR